jgi:hypothetical protein
VEFEGGPRNSLVANVAQAEEAVNIEFAVDEIEGAFLYC